MDNTITLCDLCHAVLHPHLWRAWFPQAFSHKEVERMEAARKLHEISEDYDWFCHLPPDERRRVQDEVWTTLGIERG